MMKKPKQIIEIFLHQGEIYFGDRYTRIRTLLGSCVAITIWHPDAQIGGMCHYMLPSRHTRGQAVLDGKYADEALELMLNEFRQNGVSVEECQVKLIGGGNMFPAVRKLAASHVGFKNIETGRALLKRHGLRIHAEHLGGIGHRNLMFDVWSGHVWIKHQPPAPSPCESCEAKELCLTD